MIRPCLTILLLFAATIHSVAQGLELLDYKPQAILGIGESLKIPLKLKNSGNKAINVVIQEIGQTMGSTQKHYFCIDNNCLDPNIKEYHKRLEPGEIVENLFVQVEAGLVAGQNSLSYRIFNKSNSSESTEIEMLLFVEEKISRTVLFHSNKITINEIYPNPVTDRGYIDYQIHQKDVNAKLLLHNVLGNPIATYTLSPYENRFRLHTDDVSPGIYFITLYLDNESVLTRKVIVKK